MSRLTAEDLRLSTLTRQFPVLDGRGPEAVLELFARLGPIQSQVPRSPFLVASSRLPGVDHRTMQDLFADHQLVKTSSLRGTVHTTDRAQYPLVDAVSRRQHAGRATAWLRLTRATAADLVAATEDFADDTWRSRSDIAAWARAWLAEHESPEAAARLGPVAHEGTVWGHSGLLRRPYDGRWDRRTDNQHRRARSVLPDLPEFSFEESLTALARIHLRAYGPARREDLAFFYGTGLTAVDAALARLGDEIVTVEGPDGPYLDVAEPPSGTPPTGVVLLPEFDNLLLGFHGHHRFRFLTDQQLPQVWSKVNGVFSPVVLADGLIVASWKTLTRGRRTDIEVQMLDPHPPLTEDRFADTVRATEQVLGLTVSDLRIRPAAERAS